MSTYLIISADGERVFWEPKRDEAVKFAADGYYTVLSCGHVNYGFDQLSVALMDEAGELSPIFTLDQLKKGSDPGEEVDADAT